MSVRDGWVLSVALLLGGCAANTLPAAGTPAAAAAAPFEKPSVGSSRTWLYPNEPGLQLRLARRYAGGDGVPKDRARANRWAAVAVEGGSQEARAWLEQRIANGDALAAVSLASALARSPAPIGDPVRSKQLAEKALSALEREALAGDSGAAYTLGVVFETGSVAAKNEGRARDWYERAAKQGYTPGQIGLGLLLQRGIEGLAPDPAQGTSWFRRAAEAGDAVGQYQLADAYARGSGVEKDDTQALRWFLESASWGFPPAEREAARLLDERGTPEDSARARDWLRRASDHGDSRAQIGMAKAYLGGTGVERDPAQALRLLELAAAQNEAEAEFGLGLFYDEMGPKEDPVQARRWYERAIAHGHLRAAASLGLLAERREHDYVEALSLYRKSADGGNDYGMYHLGRLYEDGHGAVKDAHAAFELYRKSAELGLNLAQNALGAMYEAGSGTERNLALARTWYERAAKSGLASAQRNLGDLYDEGLGVEKSRAVANDWYRRAADQGDATAAAWLGLNLFNAEKPRDATEACRYLLQGAKGGSTTGQAGLARCFETGDGVVKDESAAVRWYLEAAKQGNSYSEFRLGEAYAAGRGVPSDANEAEKWFAAAARHKFEGASERLAAFREKRRCATTARTELFGVKLLCADRAELRRALSATKARAIREEYGYWYDTYDSTSVLDGSSELVVGYVNESQVFGRARYTFPAHVDAGLVARVAELVSKRHGAPTKRQGDPSLGGVSYEWRLPDGVVITVSRGWPDSTTYLTYEHPRNAGKLTREIAAQNAREKQRNFEKQADAL
jgi:TPR repeat protein